MLTSRADSDTRTARGRGGWLTRGAVVASAVVIGLLAEAAAFRWGDIRGWAPDLAVGWVFVGCGLVAIALVRGSRVGTLMVAAGLVWFAGNFDGSQSSTVDWLARNGRFVYLAVLVQVAMAVLSAVGVVMSRAIGLVVAASYLVVLWPAGSRTDVAVRIMLLGAALLVVTAWAALRSRRSYAVRADIAVAGAALVALAFVGVGFARLALPVDSYENVTLSFDLIVCLSVGLLLAALTATMSERDRVTDLVVELGESRSSPIRDALRRVLGDPTVEIGYRLADAETYVDHAGRTLSVPPEGSQSVVRPLGNDVVLIHDRSLLADDQLVAAVGAAAELAATNARLQGELRAQIAELRASRRRLAIAREEGRRRLERELSEGAVTQLSALSDSMQALHPSGSEVEAGLERSRALLAQTLLDLRAIAGGLHPRVLTDEGLSTAVSLLATLSPVPVEVSVAADALDPAAESAAYFVCAEALTNIAKHAGASAARITINQTGGRLQVEVVDDGRGGADLEGSGLRGLADRVGALGGSLSVISSHGDGTRLAAEIPLGSETL